MCLQDEKIKVKIHESCISTRYELQSFQFTSMAQTTLHGGVTFLFHLTEFQPWNHSQGLYGFGARRPGRLNFDARRKFNCGQQIGAPIAAPEPRSIKCQVSMRAIQWTLHMLAWPPGDLVPDRFPISNQTNYFHDRLASGVNCSLYQYRTSVTVQVLSCEDTTPLD